MTEDNTKKVPSDPQPEASTGNEQVQNPSEKPAVVKFRVRTGIKSGPCC